MRLFSIFFVIVLVSCKTSCPKTEEEWENLLKENAINEISHIKFVTGNMDIMWSGKVENANFPMENKKALEKLPNIFGSDAYTQDTLVDNLKLVFIKSVNGSKALYSKEFGIVDLEISEPIKELLGDKISLGMSESDFILLYFKKYSPCFDEITQISFPYGMNDNGLKFEFKSQKLNKITMINYPD